MLSPETFNYEPKVQTLFICGDVGEFKNYNSFRDFFTLVNSRYERVYLIPGNHEFYRGEVSQVLFGMEDFVASFSNIYFLDNAAVEVDGVKIFGSTLWTNLSNPTSAIKAFQSMNDFRLIKRNTHRLMPDDVVEFHKDAMNEMTDFLSTTSEDDKVVILSHHAPSFKSISGRYVGSSLNDAYATNLENLILDHPQIKAWCHGHVHNYHRYTIGNCQVVCNPRGYPPGYDEAEDYYTYFPFLLRV